MTDEEYHDMKCKLYTLENLRPSYIRGKSANTLKHIDYADVNNIDINDSDDDMLSYMHFFSIINGMMTIALVA